MTMKVFMHYFRTDLVNKKPVVVNVPHKKTMMCLNESVLDPFSVIKKDFLKEMKTISLNRYFSEITNKLENLLSDYTGMPEECFLFGNGADEMLYYIFNSVRENNNSYAISLDPSYFDYKSYSFAVGLGMKFFSLNKDFDFDVHEFLKLGDSKDCRLLILCNPNNPTGNLLNDKKIIQILDNFNKLILIDETYFEFSGKTYQNYIQKYPNLIIVRSFSKAFSSAGLRFGYMLSDQQNIFQIRKTKTVFNMSLLIQAFVVSILKNKENFLNYTRNVVKMREKMFRELSKIENLVVKNTKTNFLPFSYSFGEKTTSLFEFLLKNEIAVRDISTHPILKNYLRVTVSSNNDNELFINKIKEFVSSNN